MRDTFGRGRRASRGLRAWVLRAWVLRAGGRAWRQRDAARPGGGAESRASAEVVRTSAGAVRPGGGAARVALAAVVTAALLGGVTGCGIGDEPSERASHGPRPRPTPVWDTSPESIAALGDSVTRGFDACLVLSDCPEVSWSTGTDPKVGSLAGRLLKDPAGDSWNYARTGARMADLPGQVRRAVGHRPELVTVMLGSNDACRDSTDLMTPVPAFRSDFKRSLRALRRALPKTQVFVTSVPDLKRVWAEGRRNPFGKQVWQLGICASMLGQPDAMDRAATQRRSYVQQRVLAYNAVLKEECGKDPLCRYDGGAVFDYLFSGRQLSKWDWFHPSRNGQRVLAEMAYRAVTAKKPVG
ncbi:SGNH/GDSL hydrolase family protein [Streptomyces sp. NPDC001922]|uniref:SGNH/GDSL hydrolase family protein n=1 Tax=Streptomyces sp. NPDC001922 TaxID=3364624 RepID=UPI0036A8614A